MSKISRPSRESINIKIKIILASVLIIFIGALLAQLLGSLGQLFFLFWIWFWYAVFLYLVGIGFF